MDQFILFFVALMMGVFIESPAFSGAHASTYLIWRKLHLIKQFSFACSIFELLRFNQTYSLFKKAFSKNSHHLATNHLICIANELNIFYKFQGVYGELFQRDCNINRTHESGLLRFSFCYQIFVKSVAKTILEIFGLLFLRFERYSAKWILLKFFLKVSKRTQPESSRLIQVGLQLYQS